LYQMALIAFNIIIILVAINPWSKLAKEASYLLIIIELFIIIFWCLPVFLFHLIKRKKTLNESFDLAILALINSLGSIHL
ncbi:hypothetical protein, partial [Methylovulum psychrotolerans]|uniref:hypothetical protein n=1 Tax=Methylovulum psychrotolerans TaxID=1704499 RepID=UPI001B800CD2